jgi:WD40-like Beta Propeller Repeat
MARRVVFGVLVGALMMVATGCEEECVDSLDCSDEKGSPGEGREWACVDNKCEARDVTPPSDEGDAGTTPEDAGTQPDAGTPPDAGTMTVGEGGACTSSDNCMAGLRCEGSGASKTCEPLHLAMTRSVTGGANEAVVVRYKVPDSEPPVGTTDVTKLSESTTSQSRFPRWNKDGTAVAFVEEASADSPVLVTRNIPLATGQQTTLATGADIGTVDFRYMEWEPSNNVAWSVTTKTGGNYSTSGISYVPGTGGSVQSATASGVFPSWASDGNSFAYSSGGLGLRTKVLGGAESSVAGVSTTSEQPLHNKANGVLLYLDAGGKTEQIGTDNVPLTELFTIRPATTAEPSPSPVSIAAVSEVAITGGSLKSFIANHTWAPGGTHVAYVRTFYLKPAAGSAVICTGEANCGGQQGNVIYVRRVGANGVPEGDEMLLASEATMPSFSPDGHFLAYYSGAQLRVQRINPEATDEASLKVGSPIAHTWAGSTLPSNRGDDHRPRWQPR